MNTRKVQIYKNGKDRGYLGNTQNWWFNINFEHSFSIFDLDSFYPEDYFDEPPIDKQVIHNYANYVLKYGRKYLGRDIKSILEIGSAGGWFTEEFFKRGLDIIAVEGSSMGIKKTLHRGIPSERLIKHDLRLPLKLDRTFDIILCTEVAEHIEPPFSSVSQK